MRVRDRSTGAGVDTSIDELYRRHAGEALHVARSITRNPDDASDAVSEAFAGVVQAMQQGRVIEPSALRAYLMTATRNAAIDVIRRHERLRPAGEDPAPGRHETTPGPSDRMLARADRSIVAEAFAELPPRWRAVLWLTEVEGYSPRDAAVLLKVSPNNVAQLGVRARGRLRERYVQLHVRNHAAGDCVETTERLGALVAGELTPTQARRVRGHLSECADCRARLAELEDLGLALRRAVPLSLPLLGRRMGRRWWPWGSNHGQPGAAWLGRVDPAAPAALATAGSSPAVQQVAAAVAAGLVAIGVGAAVVSNRASPPPASSSPEVAVAGTTPAASTATTAVAATPSTSTSTSTTAPPLTVPTPTTVAAAPTTVAAAPTTVAAAPAESPVAPFTPRGRLASAPSSLVAHALVPQLAVYDTPGATLASRALGHPQASGAPLVLLVVDQRPGWHQVLLPVRPNGSTGWVRAEEVTLVTHDFRIIVELEAHRITAYKGREVLLSEPIGVGTRAAPTPGGLYYIKELFQPLDAGGRLDTDGPYGAYAYGLSGFSEVLFDFAGGDGQFGIHGTNDPSGLGRDVSHGCIRMSNEGITLLAQTLPLGVPVEILP